MKFKKGTVYHFNGYWALCHQDLNPNNDNEMPLFSAIIVKSHYEDLPRATRTCLSKKHYEETDKTIKDFSHLTDSEIGLWKKWFPKWYNETTYELQKPTVKPEDEPDYDPELWDLKSADGIG